MFIYCILVFKIKLWCFVIIPRRRFPRWLDFVIFRSSACHLNVCVCFIVNVSSVSFCPLVSCFSEIYIIVPFKFKAYKLPTCSVLTLLANLPSSLSQVCYFFAHASHCPILKGSIDFMTHSQRISLWFSMSSLGSHQWSMKGILSTPLLVATSTIVCNKILFDVWSISCTYIHVYLHYMSLYFLAVN